MNRRDLVRRLLAAVAATGLLPRTQGQAASSVSHEVEIKDFAFVPARLNVALGDKVTWINADVVPHTATASDESWDSGSVQQGERQTLVISQGMTGAYYCRHHPSMKAELVIGT
ncbi:MAG: hypothetical protein HKN05_19595 [Rhizobiales bacterium]|nr:hypothetical protein [Hyphomicrobiales bacterium]